MPRIEDRGSLTDALTYPAPKYKDCRGKIRKLKQQQGQPRPDPNNKVEHVKQREVPTNPNKDFSINTPYGDQRAGEIETSTNQDEEDKTNPPDGNQRETPTEPDEEYITDPPDNNQREIRDAMEKLERRRKLNYQTHLFRLSCLSEQNVTF